MIDTYDAALTAAGVQCTHQGTNPMTIIQRLRGILTTDPHRVALFAARITYDATSTIAERIRAEWESATVRDALFRETATRISIAESQSATAWIWRFEDQSVLTANDVGIYAR